MSRSLQTEKQSLKFEALRPNFTETFQQSETAHANISKLFGVH